MIEERDVRAFLERMAAEPPIGPADPGPVIGRAYRRLARSVLVGLVLIVVAVVGAIGAVELIRSDPVPAVPTPGPTTNGALTLFGDRGFVRELEGPGEEAQRLVETGPIVFDAAWNADGTRLAYSTGCFGDCGPPSPDWGLRVFDANTGSDLLLVPGSRDSRDDIVALDWSPDGSRIAFARDEGRIFVVDANTLSVTLMTREYHVDSLSWSPDGSSIAISTVRNRMYVLRLDDSDATFLGNGSQPEWSPDGTRLAYRRPCELWITMEDGREHSLVAAFPKDTWGHENLLSCEPHLRLIRALGPVWSPDGESLAVVFANRLNVIDVDDGDVEIVQDPIERSTGGIGMGVAWRPVVPSDGQARSEASP